MKVRIRRRRRFLARLIAVTALSVGVMAVGAGTASARIMTKHPAAVTVPELKVSVSFGGGLSRENFTLN
jgi:uncharacterized membrane-anchored protein